MSVNHCVIAAALCAGAGLAMAQGQEKPCCAAKGVETRELSAPEALTRVLRALPGVEVDGGRLALTLRAGQPEFEAGRRALALRAAQPEARAHSRTVMVHSENGREYKVEINGEDVKAWIDGERVPDDQVKVSQKRIRLQDEDGETVHEFDRVVTLAAPMGRHEVVIEGQDGDDPIVWSDEDHEALEVWTAGQPAEHPPVMIGINMGPLNEDDAPEEALEVLGEHDLGAEDVVVVMGVIDSLPAAKAGLREGDILARIDGDWGVTPESLREFLMEKEPGDTVEVMVLREGEPKEFKLKLAPYDTGKLGQGFSPEARGGGDPFVFEWDSGNEDMQKLLEKLHSHRGELDGEIKELLERLQSENFGRFRQLDEMPRFRVERGDGHAPRALVTPAPPMPPSALSPFRGEEMRAHQERLERIEARLGRIEERLERLLGALESRERADD